MNGIITLNSVSRFQSCRHRMIASGKIDVCLNNLRRFHGDLFWYHPSLTGSRVLVVFDNRAAEGILKDESWIFSKALEPWQDRQTSKDPFERLLVDSLLLADGNHHKKRSSQLSGRLSSPHYWLLFESCMRERITRFLHHPHGADVELFSALLARDALEHFIQLSLTDADFDLLKHCLHLAGLGMRSQMYCPFRTRRPFSARSEMRSIDSIRDILRQKVDLKHRTSTSWQTQPAIRASNQAVVDEALLIAFSLSQKLPALIHASSNFLATLSSSIKARVGAEWEFILPYPTAECMASEWPITVQQFSGISGHCSRPLALLKRVCVCDALVCGVPLAETTEIWIPSWSSDQLLFGLGPYSCNGESLAFAITGRILQFWCSAAS